MRTRSSGESQEEVARDLGLTDGARAPARAPRAGEHARRGDRADADAAGHRGGVGLAARAARRCERIAGARRGRRRRSPTLAKAGAVAVLAGSAISGPAIVHQVSDRAAAPRGRPRLPPRRGTRGRAPRPLSPSGPRPPRSPGAEDLDLAAQPGRERSRPPGLRTRGGSVSGASGSGSKRPRATTTPGIRSQRLRARASWVGPAPGATERTTAGPRAPGSTRSGDDGSRDGPVGRPRPPARALTRPAPRSPPCRRPPCPATTGTTTAAPTAPPAPITAPSRSRRRRRRHARRRLTVTQRRLGVSHAADTPRHKENRP